MTTQPTTQAELLAQLYQECGLVASDVHQHNHYKIITRSGIEKIQFAKKITVNFDLVHCEQAFVVIKATGIMGDEVIETFGSASPATSAVNKYYPEMAEKRALSRVVLKLTKAYSLGFMGQDEADDFARPASTTSPSN